MWVFLFFYFLSRGSWMWIWSDGDSRGCLRWRPLEVVLKDSYRIKFHLDYLSYVNAAIRYYNGTHPVLISERFVLI